MPCCRLALPLVAMVISPSAKSMGFVGTVNGLQRRRFGGVAISLQGAATSVWAATAPELEGHGGSYLEDCHVAEVSEDESRNDGVRPYALDPVRAEALWELSERLVGPA